MLTVLCRETGKCEHKFNLIDFYTNASHNLKGKDFQRPKQDVLGDFVASVERNRKKRLHSLRTR